MKNNEVNGLGFCHMGAVLFIVSNLFPFRMFLKCLIFTITNSWFFLLAIVNSIFIFFRREEITQRNLLKFRTQFWLFGCVGSAQNGYGIQSSFSCDIPRST